MDGQVSLIFGGANGIGRAATQALASRGSAVVVADVDEKSGEALVEELHAAGQRALFVRTSVLEDSEVSAAVDAAEREFGKLDVVVNSAGYITRDQDDDFERNIDMLLLGVHRGVKHGVRALQRNGGGSVVNVASIAGLSASRGPAGYGEAKHGVVGMTRTLSVKLADDNIRVNSVCPGYIETDMTLGRRRSDAEGDAFILDTLRVPMKRWGRPSEVGSAIAFLASEDSSFITGHALVVDGGLIAR